MEGTGVAAVRDRWNHSLHIQREQQHVVDSS